MDLVAERPDLPPADARLARHVRPERVTPGRLAGAELRGDGAHHQRDDFENLARAFARLDTGHKE